MLMYMTQIQATIRLRAGVNDLLKSLLGVATDTAVAQRLHLNQGHYSRVVRGGSAPGPKFMAHVLLRTGLDFDRLFEVVVEGERS